MNGLVGADQLEGDFDTVIVAAPDMHGRLLGKRMSPRKFGEFAERGVAMSACTFGWDIAQDMGLEVPYAGWHTGWKDFVLIPDLRTIRRAAWLERTAIVMADIVEETDGSPVEITPRRILRRQVELLGEQGFACAVGTELEFHLYRESYDDLRQRGYHTRTPTTLIHADYAVQQVNAWEPFFQRLRRVLDESGLDVEMSQGEWGLGQWEINLTYGDPLDMCDRHVLFKLAVKDVAAQAGLSATFMPKPNAGQVGSSCHIHLSLASTADEPPAFWDPDGPYSMSSAMLSSVGGVLDRAPELMVFYAPTINSYRRTDSEEFAGRGASWGYDNRTVSCRILGTEPRSLRLEWRVPGADVNPYLAVAGLIASVSDGLRNGTDPGPARTGDVYQQEIGPLLPDTLDVSARLFRSSEFAERTFTAEVVEQYARAAEWESRAFRNAVTDWEMQRYYENT